VRSVLRIYSVEKKRKATASTKRLGLTAMAAKLAFHEGTVSC
jgi:hypothetical protein